MAIVNGLGEMSGRFGDLIFRQVNGKTVAYPRPQHFHVPQSAEAIERRNKFKTAAIFSRAILKNEILKAAWNKCTLKGSHACNKSIGYNYKFVHNCLITKYNTITPEGHEYTPVDNMRLSGNNIELKVYNSILENSPWNMIMFMAVLDPKEEGLPPFEMFQVFENVVSEMCLIVQLEEDKIRLCKKYKRYIIYAAMAELRKYNRVVWTKTEAAEGSLGLMIDDCLSIDDC